MFLLNLGAGELFALLGVAASVITALYLLDRNRRKLVVSTLRFWGGESTAQSRRSRYHVQDPWSLLLQLLAAALLLLAIAELEWGSKGGAIRNHVLLLDTSTASGTQLGSGSVLDEEKRLARDYLGSLSPRDRAMLVEVSGLVTPRTVFTADRSELTRRIGEASSSYSGLNIEQALAFASRAELRPDGEPGEVVYFGPQRALRATTASVSNLRIVSVKAPSNNRGITGLIARRDPEPNSWEATVSLHNYAASAARVSVRATFGATAFGVRDLTIAAHSDTQADYSFVANSAGELRVRLEPGDAYAPDDSAAVTLPRNGSIRMTAFTERANLLAPLLNANRRLQVRYLKPAEYRPDAAGDVVLLDQFAPAAAPARPALWIDPPEHNSPLPVKTVLHDQTIEQWTDDAVLGRGLHSHDVRIAEAHAYETFSGEVAIARTAGSTVAVAEAKGPSGSRAVITGFDVLTPTLRYQVSTPLLIANTLRWLMPESFTASDVRCQQAGLVRVALSEGEVVGGIRVVDGHGHDIPFTIRENELQAYVSRPELVRIVSAEGEQTIAARLPEVASKDWQPGNFRSGLPSVSTLSAGGVSLWRYLAGAAGIVLALEWFLFARRASTWRLALKVTSAGLLIIALIAPVVQLAERKVALVALVDTSASVGDRDLARASDLVQHIAARRGSNWVSIVPFAAEPRRLVSGNGAELLRVSQSGKSGTDLEAALTEALASIPPGYVPRVLLLSDGNENQGSVARAIAGFARLHVPVDVMPLAGRSKTDVTISSVTLPTNAYEGEQIPLTVTAEAPAESDGILQLSAESNVLGTQPIHLVPGSNTIRAHVRVKASGSVVISGQIKASAAGRDDASLGRFERAQFEQAIELKRARVLYVSQDADAADANLLSMLHSAEVEVVRDESLLDTGLHDVQLVLLNNVDLNALTTEQKTTLEQYVAGGGGLLLLGGERQVYKEDKQMDALDRALPAKLAPPRNPEGICVALIIDKSSSMEGRKIELARLSAIGVVDHLRDKDTIGVLIFDNSYQWAVPMRKAVDKSAIRRLISGITPDGGTQIAPALSEAYRKVQRTDSAYKHIVLLTDGISEEGDSLDLAKEAEQHQITISTVGLGQDVNRGYLEKVAATSGGKSYFLNNPQGLEQILLKDVQDYTGSTAVEKAMMPLLKHKAEILDGVEIEKAPALGGYARYEAKPGADTLLEINPEKHDPLYVSWQYGLGRAAVWTSDAKNRWANAWMAWPGYDKFWTNVTRDLLSHRRDTTSGVEFDAANGDLIVTYRLADGVAEPRTIPAIYVLGPQSFAEQIQIRRLGAGVYQGRLRAGWRSGFFRVRPLKESPEFPEVGVYRTEEELRDHGVNEQILHEIASATGGRFEPAPDRLFDANGRVHYKRTELWPALLAGVLLLTLTELVLRKRRGIFGSLRLKPRTL